MDKYKQNLEYRKRVDWQNDPRYVFYQRAYQIIRDCNKKNRAILGFRTALELKDYLLDLWRVQKGMCYYTKEKMNLTGYPQGDLLAFSVDRQVPSLGYVKGNIVLCCSIVNRIKQDLSIHELKEWVDKIT